jgi:hypothetical protein
VVSRKPTSPILDSEGARALIQAIDRNEAVRRENLARGAHDLRWCGSGASVTVRGYVLKDPMVYISAYKPSVDEASCIDMSLEVGTQAAGSVGHYPTYGELSPVQRANYLRWLSNGRAEPLHDIGYAFLFFYGL